MPLGDEPLPKRFVLIVQQEERDALAVQNLQHYAADAVCGFVNVQLNS